MFKSLAVIEFTTKLVRHGSWGSQDLGTYTSTMELFVDEGSYMIEWDIPDLEETEHIGLEVEVVGEFLWITGFDGIMALPQQACDFLNATGFYCPQEMV